MWEGCIGSAETKEPFCGYRFRRMQMFQNPSLKLAVHDKYD